MKTPRIAAAGLCAVVISGPAIVSADVVLEWNEIMMAVVAEQPAPNMSRFAAITQLAVFEAVNAVTGDYQPYPCTMNPSPGVSADAAAIAAAHGVLRHYFADRAAVLDEARARSLGRIPDGPAKAAGITIGETAADRAIAARANDGSEPPEFYLPSSSNPGEWQPTPACPEQGRQVGAYVYRHSLRPTRGCTCDDDEHEEADGPGSAAGVPRADQAEEGADGSHERRGRA